MAISRKNSLCIFLLTLLSWQSHALVTNAKVWVALPQTPDPLFGNLTIPANAASAGMWSPVFNWPMNGLHTVVLPDGRVLSFGTDPNGVFQDGRYYDVWDPSLGTGNNAHDTDFDPTRQDSFCAAAVYRNDGSMLISGGNGSTTSTVFNSATNNSTTDAATMAEGRWYATILSLPDGRPIILGGMLPYTEDMRLAPDEAIANGWASMTPEIYENGTWRSLFGAYSRLAFGPDYLRTSYPRAWVAPDGRVFGISADQMWYLNANGNSGNGEIISAGTFKGPYSFASPLNVGATNSAVMFDVGKILQVGGNGGFNGDELPASNMATVIDINFTTPQLIEQQTMTFARRYPNTVVLPDGKVLVTGGASYGNFYQGQPASAIYAAEIWDPQSGDWQNAASAAVYRGYHSISTLLPNGTVLSTGGGTPGPVTNLNAEIFYPPYLFENINGQSQLAQRPNIVAISGLTYANGAALELDMNSATEISRLVLIGTSNGTHSFNSGQRYIPLDFTQQEFRLSTNLPGNTIAPPGYYQLAAVNAAGVPSRGVIIAIGQNQAAPPITPPPYDPPDIDELIATPAIQTGDTVNYSVTATQNTLYSWYFSDTQSSTPFSADPAISHTFQEAGVFVVTLTAQSAAGASTVRTFVQAVATERTAEAAVASSQIAVEETNGRIWVVNPDNNSVAVIANDELLAEIPVGEGPHSLAFSPAGQLWVANKKSATISVINPQNLSVSNTINLPRASQPHGLIFSPVNNHAFVALEASGEVLKLDATTRTILQSVQLGQHVRHLSINAAATVLLASRFITPPLPGESTAVEDTNNAGAEVLVVNPETMSLQKTILLAHSDKPDTPTQGSGIPNYLAAAVISPDGSQAWLPSKQDNIKRGTLRNGMPLDFQNTVRAISSRINMTTLTEDYASRIDHDDSSLGSAALFHPNGVYLFVALETSREVAVVNAINATELFRIDTGIAPQGLAISADGKRLYIKEFLERSVRIIDLSHLLDFGKFSAEVETVIDTVLDEKLDTDVLQGKRFFYDAKNPKLARDAYLSCATCHNDGGQDGRVWDLTNLGEGLRNTIALNGHAGMAHGNLHWSANFDEVQDFEQQIRTLAGGTGLMDDADFEAGTRSSALGDAKAGISTELDQLAAYVGSLNRFAPSPYRNAQGLLTSQALEGLDVFENHCARCHAGTTLTQSATRQDVSDIGTITTHSGLGSGNPLTGIDVPTLRDVWQTAPYLHNGSAITLGDAIQAHTNLNLSMQELEEVTAFIAQTGGEVIPDGETPPPGSSSSSSSSGGSSGSSSGSNSGGNSGGGSSGGGTLDIQLLVLLFLSFINHFVKDIRQSLMNKSPAQ